MKALRRFSEPFGSFVLWGIWVGGSMLLPALPFVAVMASLSACVLCLWPKSRKSVKAVAFFMLSLGFGFWLIHGGVFASLLGGAVQPTRGLWALGLWLRILSVVSASRLWLAHVPPPLLIRSLLAGRLPASFAFLLASPLLLTEQIKARIVQIQEAQLARGVPIRGSFRERASALTALLFPLVLGLLNDLPARSVALDMKAFGLHKRRSSLFGGGVLDIGADVQRMSPRKSTGSAEDSPAAGSPEACVAAETNVRRHETAEPLELAETPRCPESSRKNRSREIPESAQSCATQEASKNTPLLLLDNAAFTAPGADVPLLTIPELRLAPGEWMLLEGGNGSGKSTLAMLLCGGVPEHRSGSVSGAEVLGEPVTSRTSLQWSDRVQFVQQNPQLSLSGCAFTLFEEVSFGPENLALPVDEIRERVEEALELVGIAHLRASAPGHLSGGEAQKAALASAVAMRPRLLLLDEAFSRIASSDTPVLLERLRAWSKRRGTALLLLERRRAVFENFCERFGVFRNGHVLEESSFRSTPCRSEESRRGTASHRGDEKRSSFDEPSGNVPRTPSFGNGPFACFEPEESASSLVKISPSFRGPEGSVSVAPPADADSEDRASRVESPALLRIRDLDFRWKGAGEPLLRSLNASLDAGERAALVGPNGAGKSTLMRLCAGLLAPERGDALLSGTPVSGMHPKERASRIGFLFQDAERQIFHSTVAEEVLFSLKRFPLSREERAERLEAALRETGLAGTEKTHPLDLNAAERRMVAVASIAVRDAELLLLDEPSRDFDPEWQERFEEWLRSRRAAVLAISHDPDFVERLFPNVWRLEEGRLFARLASSL